MCTIGELWKLANKKFHMFGIQWRSTERRICIDEVAPLAPLPRERNVSTPIYGYTGKDGCNLRREVSTLQWNDHVHGNT